METNLVKIHGQSNVQINGEYTLFKNKYEKKTKDNSLLLYQINELTKELKSDIIDKNNEERIKTAMKNSVTKISEDIHKSNKSISFYDGVPKIYKIKNDITNRRARGEDCTTISKQLEEDNPNETPAAKTKKKGRKRKGDSDSNKSIDCFQKEFQARMNRLEGGDIFDSNDNTSNNVEIPNILYFSEFAIFSELLNYVFPRNN